MYFISFKTYRITFPAFGAKASFFNIQLAIVRGCYEVDQVSVLMVLVPHVLRHQHSSSVLSLLLHLMCTVKLFFQHSSDLEWDVMKCCWKLINLKNSKTKWSHLTSCHQLKNLLYKISQIQLQVQACEVSGPFPGWRSMRRHQQAPRLNTPLMANTKVKLLCSRQVKVAPYFNRMPMLTILKEARLRQQVLSSQDPLTPWHLHSTFMFLSRSWNNMNIRNMKINCLSLFCFPVKWSNLWNYLLHLWRWHFQIME